MQAIILAAGMGRRLGSLTAENTKCMVKVDGKTLIERTLRLLDEYNINRIVIVTGYHRDRLISHIKGLNIATPIIYITNADYEKTNNIFSLALAKDYLTEDNTLLFESDVIFEKDILDSLIEDKRETLALVDKYESWMDGTCVRIDENDNIIGFISKKNIKYKETVDYYKTVNIYKFGKDFSRQYYVPFLEAYQKAYGENEYYEQVLSVLSHIDNTLVKAKRVAGKKWYEIDDVQDLDIAESLFCEDEDKRLHLIQKRFGGYWRYPGVLDFCYLVNPFFPSLQMTEELLANYEIGLKSYPSGMRVNALIAGRNFGLNQENILVGNGASELISSCMDMLSDMVGFVLPSFDEYQNRCEEERRVIYTVNSYGYRYSAEDIMSFFGGRHIDNLILVNPDNPTGNYIDRNNMEKLVNWTGKRKIRFIIDESFLDFANERNATMIEQAFLERNPHICVIKSISKEHGIPGLRLGIIASGDKGFLCELQKRLSIWNINSMAEMYMQIFQKYKYEYEQSLQKVRLERERFADALNKIDGIDVIESQTNFLMLYLKNISSYTVTKRLLIDENILVKDCSIKLKNDKYIRCAVRTKEEDMRLESALIKIMRGVSL